MALSEVTGHVSTSIMFVKLLLASALFPGSWRIGRCPLGSWKDADLFHDGGEVVVVNAAGDLSMVHGNDADAADFEWFSGLEDAFVGAVENPLNAAVIAFDRRVG